MPSVSYSRRDEQWYVLGEERRSGVDGELLLARDELPRVSAADLKRALAANALYTDPQHASAAVAEVPMDYYDEGGPLSWIGLHLVDADLEVHITSFVEWPEDGDDDKTVEAVRGLVTPWLSHSRSVLLGVEVN